MKRLIRKSGIFVLFTFCIGVLLLASCGGDDNESDKNGLKYSLSDSENKIYAEYEADWVMDQQVIDHTTISFVGDSLQVSHFPNKQLLEWFTAGDLYYSSHPYSNAFEDVNGIHLELSKLGNSYNSSYYETLYVDTHYQINYDGYKLDVQIVTQDSRLSAVKDLENDKWSITWKIAKIVVVLVGTSEPCIQTYDPALTLMLITTKRVK